MYFGVFMEVFVNFVRKINHKRFALYKKFKKVLTFRKIYDIKLAKQSN